MEVNTILLNIQVVKARVTKGIQAQSWMNAEGTQQEAKQEADSHGHGLVMDMI